MTPARPWAPLAMASAGLLVGLVCLCGLIELCARRIAREAIAGAHAFGTA